LFGFDGAAVWNDDTNAALRARRADPDLLLPTDVLYIPDQSKNEPVTHTLATGQTNTFTSRVPTFPVKVQLADAPMANRAFTVKELPELIGQTTGADGSFTIDVPVTLDAFTITFDNIQEPFIFNVGHLDPINTLSGIFQRLQNLGHIDTDAAFSAVGVDLVRRGLNEFKACQGRADSTPQSSAADSASSTPASSAQAYSTDRSGLSDDGTLDDETMKLLLAAYGC
jgi:hypothetical protein